MDPAALGNSKRGCWCLLQSKRKALKVRSGKGTNRLSTRMWCMPVLQEQKPVLVALAAANMDLMECRINIAHFKGQGLAQAQAHGIGGEDKDPVAQLASGGNETANLVASEIAN